MQNILIPIKINGERRRWNGSALSAASGGQPSATQRDIITHLWLKEISLDFLEFFDDSVVLTKKNNHRQPNGIFPHTSGSENVNISIWTFLEYFEWRKKTALCCPQTRGTLRKQYCIVLHIVKQGVPSCLHSCDNVATRCVSGSLSSIWVNCYCWGNSSMVEGRFSKWF